MRRCLSVLLAFGIVLAAPSLGSAQAQENDATAVNTKDGKSVFKLAFKVKHVNDDDVDAQNSATAYASCEDCRTVAGAIQVVLITGDTDSLNAENSAVAINYQCSECETLAAAYQFVIAGGEELEFSDEGKKRLRELQKDFKALKQRDDLTTAQIAEEMARIAGEVAKVVDTELVSAEKDREESDATTTTSPSPSSDSSTTSSTSASNEPDGSTSSTSGSAPSTTSAP